MVKCLWFEFNCEEGACNPFSLIIIIIIIGTNPCPCKSLGSLKM